MQIDYVNYALGILGVILAIIGIALSIRSIKKKEPIYSIKSNNLISGSVSTLNKLLISYNNQKIENLTVSKILFYNRGSETINKQDIQTINPLRVSSESGNILDASIIQVNHVSNNFYLNNDDEHDISFGFDYLDIGQGAVIQIIHTGLASEDLNIDGDIKGVQRLIQVPSDKLTSAKPMTKNDRRFLTAVLICGGITTYLFLFDKSLLNSSFTSYPWMIGVLVLVILVLGGAGIIIFILWTIAYILSLFYAQNSIPKGLEKFAE